jgi:mRNA interferase YafQ
VRTIERATAFRRDHRRESKGRQRSTLDQDLTAVLVALANDAALDARLRDHALSGDWSGYRECRIRPDLLLIYRKVDGDVLRLARLVVTASSSRSNRDAMINPSGSKCAILSPFQSLIVVDMKRHRNLKENRGFE